MPIYEYSCTQCGHDFEKLQRTTTNIDLMSCPSCGHETAKRVISAAGFQLKGTGWYETDFKQKPVKPEIAKTTPAVEAKTTTNTGGTD